MGDGTTSAFSEQFQVAPGLTRIALACWEVQCRQCLLQTVALTSPVCCCWHQFHLSQQFYQRIHSPQGLGQSQDHQIFGHCPLCYSFLGWTRQGTD